MEARLKISVVISVLNDAEECAATVQSLLNSKAINFELVLIDDSSASPIKIAQQYVHVYRNKHRLGVGPSRHLGACLATGEIIFFVDSHCRFTPGWDDELRDSLRAAPTALICGSMIGFDAKTPFERGKPYFGATWHFTGKDTKGRPQVFECVWQPDTGDGARYAIPAPMGACYGMLRGEYLRLGGLQYLRSWGCDEQVLSLKFWLCGGGVILNKNLKIGHRFRTGRERTPFPISEVDRLYNKLFAIHALLPVNRAFLLVSKIPWNMVKTNATKELVKNLGVVEAVRHQHIQQADGRLDERFEAFLKRFGIPFPA